MTQCVTITAADAAKKDPEQFEIWRRDPANFSFDGRYPLLEVYDKAKEAGKGMSGLPYSVLHVRESGSIRGKLQNIALSRMHSDAIDTGMNRACFACTPPTSFTQCVWDLGDMLSGLMLTDFYAVLNLALV